MSTVHVTLALQNHTVTAIYISQNCVHLNSYNRVLTDTDILTSALHVSVLQNITGMTATAIKTSFVRL